jgi:hypothetical protein
MHDVQQRATEQDAGEQLTDDRRERAARQQRERRAEQGGGADEREDPEVDGTAYERSPAGQGLTRTRERWEDRTRADA